jgi:hypothetical protein
VLGVLFAAFLAAVALGLFLPYGFLLGLLLTGLFREFDTRKRAKPCQALFF